VEKVVGDGFRDCNVLLIDLVAAFLLSRRCESNASDRNGAGIDELKLIAAWVPDQSFCMVASCVHDAWRIFVERVMVVRSG
jgi:hypothetical protein